MSDLIYTSIADCPTGNWFWLSWQPSGLVTLGRGHRPPMTSVFSMSGRGHGSRSLASNDLCTPRVELELDLGWGL